ncbi:alpha/beta-hydrolase [Schizophyllum amplum]|uniref:Alpha/beta-hydrolase n=1 Tax=Schizophyllum amplum TaxID=97359 RepID=A0A550CDZ4_9AGAR|nr:alpha/beta-hydrolase [Auriculariopsis ampla]
MASFTRTDISIPSAMPGWTLDAWLYASEHQGNRALPVIVMAHGWSCTKRMGLSVYAEIFAARGYAVVVFDYRRWGASDGTPRHILLPAEQVEDFRTVIKWARQQPQFDAQRVVVWGTSFGGGHAITIASDLTTNPAAAIAQCPYTGTIPTVHPLSLLKTTALGFLDVGLGAFNATLGLVDVGLGLLGFGLGFLRVPALGPLYMPAAGPPARINASCLLGTLFYKPRAAAAQITCPTLVLAPTEDEECPVAGARAVARAGERVELVELAEATHFEIYPFEKHYETALQAQLDFLARHVPV